MLGDYPYQECVCDRSKDPTLCFVHTGPMILENKHTALLVDDFEFWV